MDIRLVYVCERRASLPRSLAIQSCVTYARQGDASRQCLPNSLGHPGLPR